MNIAVIAANGRTGKVFVDLALAAGHFIRAGVHNGNNLPTHPNLTVVECDATKASDIAALIDGQEVVVSFIGHVKGSPEHLQTDMTQIVHDAMQAKGIDRLVSLTGTGVRFPGDKISLVDRILNAGVAFVDPARIKDGKDHVALLQKTTLKWTVLRVLKLQNVKPSPFTLKQEGPTKWFVAREDVAKAALEVVEQATFIRQAPILSKADHTQADNGREQ